jgi:hypothetical protein
MIFTLGVIGTAGRKEDKPRLTSAHFDRMANGTILLMSKLGISQDDLYLVSGGAAWADHVVVQLVLMGVCSPSHLTVYLPATLTDGHYTGLGDSAVKTASTANYYHGLFSQTIQRSSMSELAEMEKMGATLIPGNGSFHARNADVARACNDGALLAFTFGSEFTKQPPWSIREFPSSTKAKDAGLKDGGTAHTFDVSKAPRKFHCRLGDM